MRGMPIRGKGRKWWKSLKGETWTLKVEYDRSITLTPSVWCPAHGVHGTIQWGEWENLVPTLTDLSPALVEYKIEKALKEAEEFGGGYWGAILALADRQYISRGG